MSSFIYKVSNDPVLCAVSLMGRTNSDRFHRERQLQAKVAPLRRTSYKSFPEPRKASSTRRHNSPKGVNPAMDILRGVYTLTQTNHITTDSLIFRLHSNATVILLVTFSFAVTTRQYVGNPIDCVHTRDIPEEVLNTYCWIHSTYTVLEMHARHHERGNDAAYPGVENSGKTPTKQLKYYQWVAFMLFFQMLCVLCSSSISMQATSTSPTPP